MREGREQRKRKQEGKAEWERKAEEMGLSLDLLSKPSSKRAALCWLITLFEL
jgi:hypothetical protein